MRDEKEENSITNKVIELYERHKVEYVVLTHKPAVSCAEVSEIRGTTVHSAGKSMLLELKISKSLRKYALAVLPGDGAVDFNVVMQFFNCKKVAIASASDVRKMLGCDVGTVPPFSFNQEIPTIVENSLITDNEYIYHGHGKIDQSIKISAVAYKRVVELNGGKFLDFLASSSNNKTVSVKAVCSVSKNSNLFWKKDIELDEDFTKLKYHFFIKCKNFHF